MRRLIFGFAVAMFLLSVSMAAAQELKIDVTPSERTVKPNQAAPFLITMESNLNQEEGFYLFVSGAPSSWVNVDTSYVVMPARSSRELKLFFYPNDQPGSYDYEVFFQSRSNQNLIVSKKITLNVAGDPQEGVWMIDDEISKDDGSVNFKLTLSSGIEEEVTVDFSLVSDSGVTVATDTRTFAVEGEKTITHSIPILPGMVAGTYTARAEVKGTGIETQSSFGIDPVHRMVKTEGETSTPLFHEVRITIANEGNVVENDYKVMTQVPTGFLTFSREPASCEEDECEWTVEKLNPDESMQIIYRIQYWPLIAEGLIIAGLLVSFIIIGWNKASKPTLIKKMGDRSGDDYTTVLEIKNAGKKITNVVIRDQVSPLFEVKGKFETVKPAIRQTDDGTELVWTLGAIEPRDHRIIHYAVRPMVNGNLRMPKAYMTFETGSGKRSKVSTKESLLAA